MKGRKEGVFSEILLSPSLGSGSVKGGQFSMTFDTCTPHCANLSLVTCFTMHLLRAIPNAGKYLEFSIEGADYYPWQQNLFREYPYHISDGHATLTDAPGWGVENNWSWLADSIHQISALES